MSLGRSGARGIPLVGTFPTSSTAKAEGGGAALPSPMASLTSAQQLEQPQMSIDGPCFAPLDSSELYSFLGKCQTLAPWKVDSSGRRAGLN